MQKAPPFLPSCSYASPQFQLRGSGVIFHRSSKSIVAVRDKVEDKLNNRTGPSIFLPGGRKSIGEAIELCALRESYEETGFQVEFMPLEMPTRALPEDDLTDKYTTKGKAPTYYFAGLQPGIRVDDWF